MTAIFVNTGEYFLTDILLQSVSGASGWFIGWGSGTATDLKVDIDLEAEATESRVTATTEGERATASDEAEFIGTLTKTAVTADISEAALYWKSTGTSSTMFIRGTHTGVSLATEDQIRYTIRLEQT